MRLICCFTEILYGYSLDGVMTGLHTGKAGNSSLIPSDSKRLSCSPKHPDCL